MTDIEQDVAGLGFPTGPSSFSPPPSTNQSGRPEFEGAAAIGIVRVDGLIVRESPEEIKTMLSDLASECASKYEGQPLGEIPAVRKIRAIFHRSGLDPTRYRPSSESLLRRAVKGKGLYFINSVVDLINYFSLKMLCPMGLFNADLLRPPIVWRVGREGESYEGIGRDRLNLANPNRGAVVLRVVARLQPGLSLAQAGAAARTLGKQLETSFPQTNTGVSINVVSFQEQIVGDARAGLLVLLGAVFVVLLIGCVNIANLLLARATSRSREIAVRTALGAGRARVMRQLLTESVVLAGIGGRLEELGKLRKLPEGMDKQLLEEANAALASARTAWEEAGAAQARDDIETAVGKARDAEGMAQDLVGRLGMPNA